MIDFDSTLVAGSGTLVSRFIDNRALDAWSSAPPAASVLYGGEDARWWARCLAVPV